MWEHFFFKKKASNHTSLPQILLNISSQSDESWRGQQAVQCSQREAVSTLIRPHTKFEAIFFHLVGRIMRLTSIFLMDIAFSWVPEPLRTLNCRNCCVHSWVLAGQFLSLFTSSSITWAAIVFHPRRMSCARFAPLSSPPSFPSPPSTPLPQSPPWTPSVLYCPLH